MRIFFQRQKKEREKIGNTYKKKKKFKKKREKVGNKRKGRKIKERKRKIAGKKSCSSNKLL